MNDNEYLKLIGERIKHHRKLLHMSQEELANKCGYKTENARCMISSMSILSKKQKRMFDASAFSFILR